MNFSELWLPYLITHLLTFGLIFICWKRPKIAKIIWGTIFFLAGAFNLWGALHQPEKYIQGFGPSAIGFYQRFIYGPFSSHPTLFIGLIALGQLLVGTFLWLKRPYFSLGILGGVIFLLAITPLGVGSVFPSTIFMAVSLVLLALRWEWITSN
ncbi:MAG: hypothetical protein B5M54_09210 [Candidatus Aminicenantes bacterium 4484_214]|nr:hypothetical protein [Candidatus Aminicenantes bacterium]OQX52279.1 MAG: hypothetical protein B5M54_09210 [Candidatus Aminicenantes bacterium 4484_214]